MSGIYRWTSDDPALATIRGLQEEKKNARTRYDRVRVLIKERLFWAEHRLELEKQELEGWTKARQECETKTEAAAAAVERARQEAAKAREAVDGETGKGKLNADLAEANLKRREGEWENLKKDLAELVQREKIAANRVAVAQKAVGDQLAFLKKLTEDGARELEMREKSADTDVERMNALIAHAHEGRM